MSPATANDESATMIFVDEKPAAFSVERRVSR